MSTEGQAPLTPKGELTRRTVLEAAISRFGREGFRATSVADIARDADVGGTVPYAYFDNKEDLFLAALDADVAGVVNEGVTTVFENSDQALWRETLIFTLIEAVDRHPLAKRVLAGLEPTVTYRMAELPALADLRGAVADRLRADQEAGLVRPDIDPVSIGGGAVTIFISILMSVVQFGLDGVGIYGPDVLALLAAAVDPPGPPSQP